MLKKKNDILGSIPMLSNVLELMFHTLPVPSLSYLYSYLVHRVIKENKLYKRCPLALVEPHSLAKDLRR